MDWVSALPPYQIRWQSFPITQHLVFTNHKLFCVSFWKRNWCSNVQINSKLSFWLLEDKFVPFLPISLFFFSSILMQHAPTDRAETLTWSIRHLREAGLGVSCGQERWAPHMFLKRFSQSISYYLKNANSNGGLWAHFVWEPNVFYLLLWSSFSKRTLFFV